MHSRIIMALLLVTMLTSALNIQLVKSSEVVLYPTEDAYTVLGDDAGHGGEPWLDLTNASNPHPSYLYYSWIWLKFSLSSLPTDAIVTKATLKIHGSLVTTIDDETYNVSIHSCSNVSWSEHTLTRNNQPSYNHTTESWTVITCVPYWEREWHQWDATTIVRNTLLSGSSNFTIVVDTNETHTAAPNASLQKIQFVSKEQMGWGPRLEITYMLPDKAPPKFGDTEIRPGEPTSEETVNVTTSVNDEETGVKEVNLYYSIDEGATWKKVTMDLVGATWIALIPEQDEGATVRYYMVAFDNSMNNVTSATGSYIVKTTGGSSTLPPESYLLVGGIIAAVFIVGLGVFIFRKKHKTYDT